MPLKKKLKKQDLERLKDHIYAAKEKMEQYQQLLNKSVEPSEELTIQFKIHQAKYVFLLKEARHQRYEVKTSPFTGH